MGQNISKNNNLCISQQNYDNICCHQYQPNQPNQEVTGQNFIKKLCNRVDNPQNSQQQKLPPQKQQQQQIIIKTNHHQKEEEGNKSTNNNNNQLQSQLQSQSQSQSRPLTQSQSHIKTQRQRQYTMQEIQTRILSYITDNNLAFFPTRQRRIIETLISIDQEHVCDSLVSLAKQIKQIKNQPIPSGCSQQQLMLSLQAAKRKLDYKQKQKAKVLDQLENVVSLEDFDAIIHSENYVFQQQQQQWQQQHQQLKVHNSNRSVNEQPHLQQRNDRQQINLRDTKQINKSQKSTKSVQQKKQSIISSNKSSNNNLIDNCVVDKSNTLKKSVEYNKIGLQIMKSNQLMMLVPIQCFSGIGVLSNSNTHKQQQTQSQQLPSGVSPLKNLLNKIKSVNYRRNCSIAVVFLVNQSYLQQFEQQLSKCDVFKLSNQNKQHTLAKQFLQQLDDQSQLNYTNLTIRKYQPQKKRYKTTEDDIKDMDDGNVGGNGNVDNDNYDNLNNFNNLNNLNNLNSLNNSHMQLKMTQRQQQTPSKYVDYHIVKYFSIWPVVDAYGKIQLNSSSGGDNEIDIIDKVSNKPDIQKVQINKQKKESEGKYLISISKEKKENQHLPEPNPQSLIKFDRNQGDLLGFISKSAQIQKIMRNYTYMHITNVNNLLAQIGDISVLGYLESKDNLDIVAKIIKPLLTSNNNQQVRNSSQETVMNSRHVSVDKNGFISIIQANGNLQQTHTLTKSKMTKQTMMINVQKLKSSINEPSALFSQGQTMYQPNLGNTLIDEYFLKIRLLTQHSGPLNRLLLSRIKRTKHIPELQTELQLSMTNQQRNTQRSGKQQQKLYCLSREFSDILHYKFSCLITIDQTQEFSHAKLPPQIETTLIAKYPYSHIDGQLKQNGAIGYSNYCKKLLGMKNTRENDLIDIDSGILHKGSRQIEKVAKKVRTFKDQLAFPLIMYSEFCQ